MLRRPQWIDFRGDAFDSARAALVEAVAVNGEWLRRHTRIGLRATECERGRRDPSFLLAGGRGGAPSSPTVDTASPP
jgi:hypothetical protein